MTTTTLLIQAREDILARTAANITQELRDIDSSIYFRLFGRQVNAKTLIGLLTLGIRESETFEAYIISTNETAAAIDLERFVRIIEPYCEITSVD